MQRSRIETPANRERRLVSDFTGCRSTFQRSARMKKPKVATATDARSSHGFPVRMFAQTSENATSASAHHSARTVMAIPKSSFPQCFTRAAAPA